MTQLSIDVLSDEGVEFPISMRVPEPSVGMLLAFGLCGPGFVQARRRLHARRGRLSDVEARSWLLSAFRSRHLKVELGFSRIPQVFSLPLGKAVARREG